MGKPAAKKKPFPWIPFILLLGSTYVFWILPRQLGPTPLHVEFEEPRSTAEGK